jgi:hypothetical protein
MTRVGQQGERVGEQAKDDFEDNEAKIQEDSDQEGAAKVLGRIMLMTMCVLSVRHE